MKQLLKQEEAMVPALFSNLRKALVPLMHNDLYITMNQIRHQVDNSGKEKQLSTRGQDNKKLIEDEDMIDENVLNPAEIDMDTDTQQKKRLRKSMDNTIHKVGIDVVILDSMEESRNSITSSERNIESLFSPNAPSCSIDKDGTPCYELM